jgi:hypothetical protein
MKGPGRIIAASTIDSFALIERLEAEPPTSVDFTAAAPLTAK